MVVSPLKSHYQKLKSFQASMINTFRVVHLFPLHRLPRTTTHHQCLPWPCAWEQTSLLTREM